jgi:hypothetical protein
MGRKKNKIIKIGVQILTFRDLISIYQGNVYEAALHNMLHAGRIKNGPCWFIRVTGKFHDFGLVWVVKLESF